MDNRKLVKTIKKNLNYLLRDQNIKEIALLIDKSPPTVYRYLNPNNKFVPSVKTLNILSEKYNYDITNFFK